MSQDPVTQAPFSTQRLNRYSYVMNNPINATDPSGFLIGSSADGIGILDHEDGPAWLPYGSGAGAGPTFGQVVNNASTTASAVGLGVNIVADGLALFNLQGTPDVVLHMTPTATVAGTGSGRGSTTAVGQSSATIRDGLPQNKGRPGPPLGRLAQEEDPEAEGLEPIEDTILKNLDREISDAERTGEIWHWGHLEGDPPDRIEPDPAYERYPSGERQA